MITIQEAIRLAKLTEKSMQVHDNNAWHGGQKPRSKTEKAAIEKAIFHKINALQN